MSTKPREQPEWSPCILLPKYFSNMLILLNFHMRVDSVGDSLVPLARGQCNGPVTTEKDRYPHTCWIPCMPCFPPPAIYFRTLDSREISATLNMKEDWRGFPSSCDVPLPILS